MLIVPLPRQQLDQILRCIPLSHRGEQLVFRLIVEGGLPPDTVLRLRVEDIAIHADQALLTSSINGLSRTIALTDRALVAALATYLRSYRSDGYLFREPCRRSTLCRDDMALTATTLLERWENYCTIAQVHIPLALVVQRYAEARQQHGFVNEDLDTIRQELQALRERSRV